MVNSSDKISPGSIVISLAGHDKGDYAIVIASVGDEYVFIADGKRRKLSGPKRKKIKHLCFIKESHADLPDLTNVKIRRLLNAKELDCAL